MRNLMRGNKCFVLSYLLGNQKDTGFHLLMPTFQTTFDVYILWWEFGECQSEVKRRMQ